MTTVMELSEALAGAVERAATWVVAVHGRPRLPSTGIHWRSGLVVTASHTVESEGEVTLTAPDGRTVPARVAGRDPGLDIAVLRADIDAPSTPELAGEAVRVGHLVVAIGAGPRASAGIVSALDVPGAGRGESDLLAVDLILYPGFSGGPLVDVLGRLVGVVTSGASRHLRCAVRAAAVSGLVEQVVERGRIPRAYLGVGTQTVELPASLRDRLGLAQRTAAVVVSVRSDSPAAAGGLIVGDVVVAIGGHTIARPEDLLGVLRPERVGETVAVSILRGGEPRELAVSVGERPARN